MSRILLLMAWLMSQGQGQGQKRSQCGGTLTAPHGVIQTPHFPLRFSVPLRCRWVIDASQVTSGGPEVSIVVYFTQLFVTSGLLFTEFDYYEHHSTFQLGGRELHRVTEENVVQVDRLVSRCRYLVVDFLLDRLEGNHLRALDSLLEVYGFNITYHLITDLSADQHTCSVVTCSLSGHCYAAADFKEYRCACFQGFSGHRCEMGPLCQPAFNVCEHGAACKQVGAATSSCSCPEGLTGLRCEVRLTDRDCSAQDGCTLYCPEDDAAEPCSCGQQRTDSPRDDRAQYEGTLRLANGSSVRQCLESVTCTLRHNLTEQITKYLESSDLSVTDNVQVLNISLSGDVRFHFWSADSEGSRVREALNRLAQRGRLGDWPLVTTRLAITREPALHLKSVEVNHPRQQVRQGDSFVLSCVAQGSSLLTFRWYKDGVLINITRANREMWSRRLPLDTSEQHTALLGVGQAHPLDQGRYTCQVLDWGRQQCRSIVLEVLQEPLLRLDPLSITVDKGENVTFKCTSPNELQHDSSRFGYSWTKNNALFRMTPGVEYWEDLYPSGSLLRVNYVQRSAVYRCHVHGSAPPVSRTARLEVLSQSAPWCPTDETGVGGVRWSRAGPGGQAVLECPAQYTGLATRLCLLGQDGRALWQTPDYSRCVSDRIRVLNDNFLMVVLGYGTSTVSDAVLGVLTSLRDRAVLYPGEGEPVVSLLSHVTSHLNSTGAWGQLTNTTGYFYSAVNTLLLHRNSVINHQKVEELHQTVNLWTELWTRQDGPGSTHIAYDSLVVDLFRFDQSSVSHGSTITLPRPTLSYPPWYSSPLTVHIDSSRVYHNQTMGLGVVVHHRLTDFLPLRYSQVLTNGSEVQYELTSDLVTLVVQGPLRVRPSLDLPLTVRVGWQTVCGLTLAPSTSWDTASCQTVPSGLNRTVCHCSGPGTYGLLVVQVVHKTDHSSGEVSPGLPLLGCACCLTQTLLTAVLLTLRWYRRHCWLIFLQLQCCASVIISMAIFLYAFRHTISERYLDVTSSALQVSALLGLSCHLGQVLMVYTEIIRPPDLRHIRQAIIAVIYGVPALTVMGNHIARVSLATPAVTWWLAAGSTVFYSTVTCGLLLVLLFTFLQFHVSKLLESLLNQKNVEKNDAIERRLGLLRRAALVFGGEVTMATSSVIYVNHPSTGYQYLFSSSCALLGLLVLVCYVLHGESSSSLQLPPDDSSPLSLFTKQEPDVECEGAPAREESGAVANGAGSWGCREPDTTDRIITVSGKVSSEGGGVCVITSVVVDTPGLVVCSVDLTDQARDGGVTKQSDVEEALKEETSPETEGDVMDRICHDLDFLLGDVDVHPEVPTPNIVIQNTSL